MQFPGLSINGFVNASNAGIVFFTLKPFDERTIQGALRAERSPASSTSKFGAIQDAFVAVFPPPPVMGLGTLGGFKMQIEDRAGLGDEELYKATQALIRPGVPDAGAGRAVLELPINVPQLYVDVDRAKVKQQGVPLTDVFQTCRSTWARCT